VTAQPEHVLVVGAGLGGLRTVEQLRAAGYQGRISLTGAEVHPPYDRPPLSKQLLTGDWEVDRVVLRTEDGLDELGVRTHLGLSAVALRPGEVELSDGASLYADAIVLATGLVARSLPGQPAQVHTLRTLDDALALRADLLASSRLVVVGEGVLGAEIAATAHGMGLEVTMAGPQPAPMTSQVGPLVAGLLAELHTERGVRLRLGAGVSRLSGHRGRVTGVRLDTGEVLPADVVVVAIGADPATEWLAGSGLRTDNGLVCDSRCRAAEGIYAVGDVARWHHDRLGISLRLENRTNAIEQADIVAANILGDDQPYRPVPYFWTDQFDARIQVHGVLPAGAEVTVTDGDLASRRFVALYRHDGRVTGVLGWNMPKQTRLRRQEVVDALPDLAPAL
jgi:NADPH-dependent 2,4-dienoyl-CoA reductase/sulfur reductase-like enzyme